MGNDEAKRRYEHPGVQRRLKAIKDRDWETTTMPASAVFAMRLRETREARGWSLAELARRMTVSGHPLSKTQLHLIETGQRRLALDEAFGLTEVLRAVPANMLIPPEGKAVRLGPGLATDGPGMRTWLASGLAYRSNQPPAAEIEDDVRREQLIRDLARAARSLDDAVRMDDEEAKTAAVFEIMRLVDRSARRRR